MWIIICMLSGGCRPDRRAEPSPDQKQEPGMQSVPSPSALPESFLRPRAISSPPPADKPLPSLAPTAPPAPSVPPAAAPSPAATAGPAPEKKAPPAAVPKKDKPPAKQAAQADAGQKIRQKAESGARTGAGKAGSLTELRRKYADSFIFSGRSGKRQIALTFDDAPDTLYTPRVLDILKKNNVKATFFIVGSRAEQHPDIVKRIAREGHVIGNHSYGHALLKKLPQEKFIEEIEHTQKVLAPLAGYTPRLVRPPYGAVNDDELAWLKEQGYLTVNWNVDPEDWKGTAGSEVLRRSIQGAGPGSIILMHSATGQGGSLQGTIDALPGMIEALRGKGFELVTLPDLLQTSKAK